MSLTCFISRALSWSLLTLMAVTTTISCKTLPGPNEAIEKHRIIAAKQPQTVGIPAMDDHPDASYYLLSSARATDDDGSMRIQTMSLTASAQTAIRLPQIQNLLPSDIVLLTGDVFLFPQDDLSAQSLPARLSLSFEGDNTPLVSRLFNVFNQSFGHSLHLFSKVSGQQAIEHPLALQLALIAPGEPKVGPLKIAHARIEAQVYRAVKRNALKTNPEAYLLLNQEEVYDPKVTTLTGEDQPLFELPDMSLKKGDLVVVSHQWELTQATLAGDCAGVWVKSWMTLDDAQSGLSSVTRELPAAPRQRVFMGSVTLTATQDGIFRLRLKTHLNNAKCAVPVVAGSTHFMAQQFRPSAKNDTNPADGYYLYRLAAENISTANSLKVRGNRTVGDLPTLALDPFNQGDLLFFEAGATLATDYDFTSTSVSLQLLAPGELARTAIRSGTMENGLPRIHLDVIGGYGPAEKSKLAGESLSLKLAAQNALSHPLWVESTALLTRHFTKIPSLEADGRDAAAELIDRMAPTVEGPSGSSQTSRLFKETSLCPLFTLVGEKQEIRGGPPVGVPLPLSQFGGSLNGEGSEEQYTVHMRAGQSYALESPWIIFAPDQAPPNGYTEVFYNVVVSKPREADCQVWATKT